jgi:glyoxylate/hydroxypyruvate reductase A
VVEGESPAEAGEGHAVADLAGGDGGAHLVDADLLALLDSGHLAGAALDVFREEPLPAEHPFWRHPKITVTPHTSARTLRDESIAQIARKLRAFERGEPIAGVVDRQRGY